MEYNITYRQKDKGWQFIISRKDENGKWKQIKSKQGFKTKNSDAKPAAEDMLEQLKIEDLNKKNIINIDYESITFKELCDKFLEHSRLYKEFNTVRGYRNAIASFSSLNNVRVKNIKRIDIQNCIDKLIEKKLKASSIKIWISRIKLIFDYYTSNYDPNYKNPTLDIVKPKNTTPTEKKALTKKELDNLLAKLKTIDPYFYIVSLIAGTCGLRYREIIGLTWNDINEINLSLNVNKQWKKLKDNTNNFGELKTRNSTRIVPIPKDTLTELKNFHKTSITDKYNRILITDGYNLRTTLNLKLHELAGISVHELRHTYATLLVSNNIDFKTIAKFLGHDVQMTIKSYSHITDDMIKNATDIIGKIF